MKKCLGTMFSSIKYSSYTKTLRLYHLNCLKKNNMYSVEYVKKRIKVNTMLLLHFYILISQVIYFLLYIWCILQNFSPLWAIKNLCFSLFYYILQNLFNKHPKLFYNHRHFFKRNLSSHTGATQPAYTLKYFRGKKNDQSFHPK